MPSINASVAANSFTTRSSRPPAPDPPIPLADMVRVTREAADGLALIRELRGASPLVRIIVLAGWPPDLEGAPEAQMVNKILAKPIRTAALLGALAASAG